MCAAFCGESAPLEQYYYNYTFPVLSFLPPAHVHTMILQNVCFCCFFVVFLGGGVGPAEAVQL